MLMLTFLYHCHMTVSPRMGSGYPLSLLFFLSIHFLIFCSLFYFFPFSFSHLLYLFSSFVHPFILTRIVPVRFQAGGCMRRPNLGLVCCIYFNILLAFLHWVGIALHLWPFASHIAIFVLKRDIKHLPANQPNSVREGVTFSGCLSAAFARSFVQTDLVTMISREYSSNLNQTYYEFLLAFTHDLTRFCSLGWQQAIEVAKTSTLMLLVKSQPVFLQNVQAILQKLDFHVLAVLSAVVAWNPCQSRLYILNWNSK